MHCTKDGRLARLRTAARLHLTHRRPIGRASRRSVGDAFVGTAAATRALSQRRMDAAGLSSVGVGRPALLCLLVFDCSHRTADLSQRVALVTGGRVKIGCAWCSMFVAPERFGVHVQGLPFMAYSFRAYD